MDIKTKLLEGQGEIIHEIHSNVEENLEKISKELNIKPNVLARVGDKAEVLIRKDTIDLRICICGNVDAGKSTLLGVLTSGEKDNGRGYARLKIFKHRHEQETGRTSSVSYRSIGFDTDGNVMNYDKNTLRMVDKKQMIDNSSKLVTLYDLAGHEKYLKTTMFGISSSVPDYAMIVISANNGIQRMTKEHMCICLALKIPFFIVITRIDACPTNVYESTISSIEKIIKNPGIRKIPYYINSMEDVIITTKNLSQDKIVPIISVSNVTHERIDLVRKLLNLLPIRKSWNDVINEPSECVVDSMYQVPGVGCVLAGLVSKGCISVNDSLNLGPDVRGKYKQVQIRSIQINGINKKRVEAGKVAAFNIVKHKGFHISKGMVLLDNTLPTIAVWEFQAEIKILYHSTTINIGYEPVINFGSIKQSAKIIKIEKDRSLRTGDKAIVTFKFKYKPEYILSGTKIILRENKTRGVGIVL